MMDGFKMFYKEKKEHIKVETLQTMKRLVEIYHSQVLKKAFNDPKEFHALCTKQTFSTALLEELVKFLTEYFDNVREQA